MVIDPGRSPECWEYDVVDPDSDVRVKTRTGFSLDVGSLSHLDANDIAGLQKAICDAIYPVGSFYVQYPDAESNDDATAFPVAYRPVTLFGGTWVEQWPTESVFFRTQGTLSDAGRVNGKQESAFMAHWHRGWGKPTSGLGYAGLTGNDTMNGDGYIGNTREAIGDGTHGTPLVASETRSTNRLKKIWKRTAL